MDSFYSYVSFFYNKVKSPIVNYTQNYNQKQKHKYKKKQIPKAIREQVWIKYVGKKYEDKCFISWCTNRMDVFNFQTGHNIPESKGGEMTLDNLRPICGRCNLSMGNEYTIEEWDQLNAKRGLCPLM